MNAELQRQITAQYFVWTMCWFYTCPLYVSYIIGHLSSV